MTKTLDTGTRVRTKVRGSWGSRPGSTGTVLYDRGGLVHFIIDGQEPNPSDFCRYQVAVCRDQTPNPKHIPYT